jgi:hypothetical protein
MRRGLVICPLMLGTLVLGAQAAHAQASPPNVSAPPADAADTWAEVGRQGITRFVIVPMAQARDRQAYAQQIDKLCQPNESCFLNFFTNSSGIAVGLPLPDAVLQEPTVIYRRSPKQGAELFRWSCRLALPEGNCF